MSISLGEAESTCQVLQTEVTLLRAEICKLRAEVQQRIQAEVASLRLELRAVGSGNGCKAESFLDVSGVELEPTEVKPKLSQGEVSVDVMCVSVRLDLLEEQMACLQRDNPARVMHGVAFAEDEPTSEIVILTDAEFKSIGSRSDSKASDVSQAKNSHELDKSTSSRGAFNRSSWLSDRLCVREESKHPIFSHWIYTKARHVFVSSISDERALDETMWEAVLLMGWEEISRLNAFFLALSFAGNLFIQVLFGVIIEISFRTQVVDRSTVKDWRYTIGHSFEEVDSAGRSLVSRVCQGDETLSVAGDQLSALGDAEAYTRNLFAGVNAGPMMCLLTLCMWFMLWCIEVLRSVELQCAFSELPRSRTRVIYNQAKGTNKFISISRMYLVLTSLVTFSRVVVASWLLWQGTVWILNTQSLEEMVLNGVALAFIRDADEMIFSVFVPLSLNKLTKTIEPLPVPVLPKRPTWASLFMIGYLAFVGHWVNSASDNMEGILEDGCGGDHNFVVSKHMTLNTFHSAKTQAWELYEGMEAAMTSAVQELTDSSGSDSLGKSNAMPSLLMLRSILSSSASEVADMVMTEGCVDIDPSKQPLYWASLQRQLNSNATSCKELESQCGHATVVLIRMACPHTCRCLRNKPISILHQGCPYKQCQEGGEANNPAAYYDRTIECVDQTAASLAASDSWRRFWQSYIGAVSSPRFSKCLAGAGQMCAGVGANDNAEEIQTFALSAGCAVVDKFNLTAMLCADNSIFQPVGSYCPITCGCLESDYWGCPWNCRADW